MLLVLLVGLGTAATAQRWSFIQQREVEEELELRTFRILRAVIEYQSPPVLAGTVQYPAKLEELEKVVPRVIASVPPDPLTARYDDEGELLKDTGRWGPVQWRPGGAPGQQTTFNLISCDQKVTTPTTFMVGIRSCDDRTAIRIFPGVTEEPAPYDETVFTLECIKTPLQQGGQQQAAGGVNAAQLQRAQCFVQQVPWKGMPGPPAGLPRTVRSLRQLSPASGTPGTTTRRP
jgi:hypothetical protein